MLTSILTGTSASVSFTSILICGIVSIILGFIIAITHKWTSRYNKNFLITLTMLPLFVASVILLVNGNLGMSVAIAGTFGLVRFRSIPGTSKEIVTVFFAMAVGLAIGMGYIAFAGLLTILGSLVLLLFNNLTVFDRNKNEKYLKITIPEDLDYTEVFDETLKKYTTKYNLDSVKTTNLGSMFELKYSVTMKDKVSEKIFLDDLRVKNGNLKIALTGPTDTIDL